MSITAIQTVTVASGGVTEISFSSIPANYDQLEILASSRCTSTSSELVLTFNGQSSNWGTRHLGGSQTSVFTNNAYQPGRMYLGGIASSSYTANVFSSTDVLIRNYASSANKPVFSRNVSLNDSTNNVINFVSGLWSNSSTVTSIQLFFQAGTTFEVGSTFTLYGITAGSDGTTTVS
jgi:hypothetical protein